MDDRIKVTVSVVCLTRYQNLIANGAMGSHSFYLYVPNMLAEKIDAESVVGLIAPRPHLGIHRRAGSSASPVDGVKIIYAFQEHLYKLYGKKRKLSRLALSRSRPRIYAGDVERNNRMA